MDEADKDKEILDIIKKVEMKIHSLNQLIFFQNMPNLSKTYAHAREG